MDSNFFGEYLQVLKVLLHVFIIMFLAWLLLSLSKKVLHVFRDYLNAQTTSAEESRRIETLTNMFRRVVKVLISLVAGMLVLSELGISIAPILGAAGVFGIAVGFGAQSLIKDYYNGFFLLLENQIRKGDVVEVSTKSGLVEDVTLRYVCLRDYEGNVHYIPNSLITTVTNKSRGYAYAVVDVGVSYGENLDEVFNVMREVAAQLRSSPDFGEKILDDIEIAGLDQWADSALILRCRFKTCSLEQWGVRREFLKRLKERFDECGIEIPNRCLTIYAGQGKQGNAPSFHVTLQQQADDPAIHVLPKVNKVCS